MEFHILYSTPFLSAANQRIEVYVKADTEEAAMAELRSWFTPTEWAEVNIHRVRVA